MDTTLLPELNIIPSNNYSSIEGILRKIGDSFFIEDLLVGEKLSPIFIPAENHDKDNKFMIYSLSMLANKRVSISGFLVDTNFSEEIYGILIDNVSLFPPESELPGIDEMIGILK